MMFSLRSLKSPGPDGLPTLFYQHYWQLLREDIIGTVQSFFRGTFLLKELNHTHIALVPKGGNLATVNNFRPINLSNVIYKVI